jgi:hypothetical protein
VIAAFLTARIIPSNAHPVGDADTSIRILIADGATALAPCRKKTRLLSDQETDMTDIITMADKLACAERELKYRKYVYARRVDENKMSAGKAAHEIACMEAIIEDYRKAVEKERLI